MVRGFRWALVFGLLAAVWAPVVGRANPDIEHQSSELVARERGTRGIAAYEPHADLADVARRHAARMAAEGRLYHNPNLATEVGGWDAVGENVGRGESADAIHRAFMDSDTHRNEILSSTFTQFGVGAAVAANGEVWIAQVFRKPSAPRPPPPPPAEPRPHPEPQPVRASRAAPPAPPVTAAPTPAPVVAAPPPTTTTTVVIAPDLSALEGAFDPAPVLRPRLAAASITSAGGIALDVEPDVSFAVRIAASLLVLVVAMQTRYVARQVGGVTVPMPLRRKLAATAATLP